MEHKALRTAIGDYFITYLPFIGEFGEVRMKNLYILMHDKQRLVIRNTSPSILSFLSFIILQYTLIL